MSASPEPSDRSKIIANIFLKLIYFYFWMPGSLLLRVGFLSSCGKQGLLLALVHGLLIAVASPVVEHGL